MTRNDTSSSQSLRSAVSNMNLASEAESTEAAPENLNRPSMQIFGQDAYTKTLMNLVATGEATAEQQAEFEQYVAKLQRSSRDSRPSLEQLKSNIAALKKKASKRNTAQNVEEGGLLSQLKRLEQENEIRREQLRFLSPTQDSQNRISFLEAKNASYAAEQAELQKMLEKTVGNDAQGADFEDKRNTRRWMMVSDEKESLSGHGMPGSTWERQHNPLLQKTPKDYTAAESREFERLWKQYLARKALHRQGKRAHQSDVEATAQAEAAASRAQRLQGFLETRNDTDEAEAFPQATSSTAGKYCKPFCDFLTENPTVFHAVGAMKKSMKDHGWTELSERDVWDIKPNGHYFVDRNGSALICFVVGAKYEPGNGAAIIAGHVDALTAKLKPVSQVPNKAGYLQLGVAPYAGGLGVTWWDRDLGIGGRVLVKEGNKIVSKLVKLDWPIAKIPTLAPHFGQGMVGQGNMETQMVPIIGLDSSDSSTASSDEPLGGVGSFASTQPPKLVRAIANEIGLNASEISNIVQWELELFDTAPANTIGLDRDLISAGRIDDKLCSWAAWMALLESQVYATRQSSIIKVVGMFDNEEIGSLLRQGARGNFLPTVMERAVGSLADHQPKSDFIGRTYANSFLASCDVTHAVNPNFESAYLANHAPQLNVGVTVSADSNGHMTTDAISTAIFKRCAEKTGSKLQVFQIRNDSRSGGTVGPMLSSMTGIRAIDAGIPQLSMHSIRATTGSLDPGLGVIMFTGFLNGYESVDKEFR